MTASTSLHAAADPIDHLRAIGREFHGRSWSLGTSSNYSVVTSRDPLRLLITASGKDKSALGRDDFVTVDAQGKVVDGSARRSSAETLLHCMIAELLPGVGAVLHTHSVCGSRATRCSRAWRASAPTTPRRRCRSSPTRRT
jgi:ribulose-5-phosphate 4-epimerase/fuculose-1-phosphate aldolase